MQQLTIHPGSTARPQDVLEGTLERVVFANPENGWTVVRLAVSGQSEPVTAVGNFHSLQPGESLRLHGSWIQDPKYGRQFRAASYAAIAPATLGGIQRYLGSGLIHGIGKVMAKRLVAAFGLETLEVIEHQPGRLAEVGGIGPKRRAEIRRAFLEQREIKEVMVFLQSYGVGTGHALRIFKRYGTDSMRVLRENPYRLAIDIHGIGFKSADKIAAALGTPKDAPQRMEAGVLHLLAEGADRGHLFLPEGRLLAEGSEMLGAAPEPIGAAVERLDLAPAQREAIRQGLTSKLLVITGGPGTGKTTLVRGIVEILEKKGQKILLAAPTGRAAKRLSEATGGEAATIHRLLEWNAQTRAFDRNRERPLACDLLIVDEASMLDTLLAHHLLRALPDDGRLILVGDVDQLPSVGPGSVLADLIRSDAVEVVRLTEIFRQAERSLIVVNAHRINQGQMPVVESVDSDGDFFFFERREPEEVVDTICQLVARRIPAGFKLDPLEQIQVLTPRNRGPLGTEALNARLRDLLNPEGEAVTRGGQTLRVGDKVMQVRNNYDLEVFNGDIGRVAEIDAVDQLVRVTFDGRAVVYDFASLDELVLSYACSIHKSQGSEYPCVVIPLHTTHYLMLQRNLLYTAVTRARRLAILVGEERALRIAVGNRKTRERFTRLAERLRGA